MILQYQKNKISKNLGISFPCQKNNTTLESRKINLQYDELDRKRRTKEQIEIFLNFYLNLIIVRQLQLKLSIK